MLLETNARGLICVCTWIVLLISMAMDITTNKESSQIMAHVVNNNTDLITKTFEHGGKTLCLNSTPGDGHCLLHSVQIACNT